MSISVIGTENKTEQLRKFLRIAKESNVQKRSPFYTLKATHKRLNTVANFFRKAYRKDTKVAYRSVIMPTEIFFAMDMVPICVEMVSAMLAGSAMGPRALNIAEENHYSRDICSFARCILGAAIEDYLPSPDFLASTSYYCDDTPKLFYTLGKMYSREPFLLDVPYDYKNNDAIEYLARQLEKMVSVLEKAIGRRLDPKRLSQAIEFSNEARDYFVKVNELRKNIPAPILGGEAIDYATLLAFTWGSREMVDVYKMLYEEVRDRVNTGAKLKKSSKPRILWRHLRPYYNNYLMEFIERELNCEIAFEEINYIHWGPMDPKDPYRSLARKLILNSPVGPIEHWMEDSFGLLDKYSIDAVVSFTHWGCRQLASTNHIFKEALEKRGIPMLELGGDCIDSRDYSFQQIKTRIQAFIEMLGGER